MTSCFPGWLVVAMMLCATAFVTVTAADDTTKFKPIATRCVSANTVAT
ncbi:MAG: hypothetical protein J0L73_08125 [Verrucomicrobia bacterium]|nr:hypothetical protein [Verrucomicrobiota bacterium]